MRLVNDRSMTAWQRRHAWPSEQALTLVRQALLDRQPVDGLAELRASLLIGLDSEVLDQIERGEWWLVRPEADYVEWAMPDRSFDPKVLALMQNSPAQPSRAPLIYRLVESAMGEPLVQRHYLAKVNGESNPRRTDGEGIVHFFISVEVQHLSMAVIGA